MESFWTDQISYINDIFKPIIIFVLILSPILIALFAFGFYRRYQIWHLGKEDNRTDHAVTRVKTTLGVALAHLRLLSEAYPGWMHFLMFWGAAMLVVGKIIRLFSYVVHLDNPPQDVFLYASLVSEIGAGLLVIGGLLAIYRRYIVKPSRLNTKPDDTLIFPFVFLILLTGFMVKGYRIATSDVAPTDWSTWAPISYGFSKIFPTFITEYKNQILIWHRTVIHVLPAFIFLVYIFVSRSRIQHLWLSPLNIFLRSLKPKGALVPIDLENTETFGTAKIEDFTWKQLLDLDACTRCGRCQDNCPAYLSGKALSPKKVIQDLREHLYKVYPYPLIKKPEEPRENMITDAVTEEVIWDCTTCRACQEACPVFIEHIDKIVDMRRNLVLDQAKIPETTEGVLRCIETRGHSCRGTTFTRTDWTEGLEIKVLAEKSDVDILYWVGCVAALEDRNRKVAIAFAKLLKAAGVNFGILGDEETCCGEPVRRIGNEYLFQMQAQRNIETLKNYNVRKIVTACPHCFNTIKNEYPQFGGEFEVIHHSEFIAQLLKGGRLKLTSSLTRLPELNQKVTYHDSCYLGRYNDIYEPPREILREILGSKPVEMRRHHQSGLCCGGGGGHFWVEERVGTRINEIRTEEIIKTGAQVVATACPYCLQMFGDAIKAKGKEESLKAIDLAELVILAMNPGP